MWKFLILVVLVQAVLSVTIYPLGYHVTKLQRAKFV